MFEVFELSYWKNIFVLNRYQGAGKRPADQERKFGFKNSDILINNIVHTDLVEFGDLMRTSKLYE